jgi:16S rRNA (adenine1518-N6/adenine1519-N6)-dimethyltransferase
MTSVRPKKRLGQHFLRDENIAKKIVSSLTLPHGCRSVVEVGPGTGVLTRHLLQRQEVALLLVEVDGESVDYLKTHFASDDFALLQADFLQLSRQQLPEACFALIGNFPYNISSQIFFKLLTLRDDVPEVVCMIQREVAERLASPPGSKAYGILSVLLQAYYHIELLFKVSPGVFYPPPKVESAVIRLVRNERKKLSCDEALFVRVVKQSFQNRRKTLRNALKPINLPAELREDPMMGLRAEQLSVEDFIHLTTQFEAHWKT